MSPDPSALNSMRQVDYESVESGNAVPSPITPSVNPQLTRALPTVETRLNRFELSGMPTAVRRVACPRLCVGMSSGPAACVAEWIGRGGRAVRNSCTNRFRGQKPRLVFDAPGAPGPNSGSTSRDSNPKCLKIAHGHLATHASQVAGRTIFGYDILPRTQGHAHAKPWAWHPARVRHSVFCFVTSTLVGEQLVLGARRSGDGFADRPQGLVA
jgi:hypothetical protein